MGWQKRNGDKLKRREKQKFQHGKHKLQHSSLKFQHKEKTYEE